MKVLFSNFRYIGLALFSLVALQGCDKEDYLVLEARPPQENLEFINSISSAYSVSKATRNSLAERFVWNIPDFKVQTTISYQLQGSINPNFSTLDYDSGTLSETNHGVTMGNILGMAELLGLDDDPTTKDDAGNPNNAGIVYFRVKAFIGSSDATNGMDKFSEAIEFSFSIVEKEITGVGSGIAKSAWGVVGSAANDWGGAGPDLPFYTTGDADVYVAYVNLKDGEIKFRENNDWGNNLGDDGADGTLEAGGANLAVTAGDYKITLDLGANTYSIEAFTWGIVGSAWNDWGGAGPDAKLHYDYTTDTFKAGVKLLDGEMKFRFNNDWGNNLGDDGADGTLEANGANIVVTAGFYAVTFDLKNNAFTIEAADLWGVVGSGYNDWGGAGPDFTFTEVNPGYWMAQNVTLIDGEIKFRLNEDWGNNLGDDGADGTLEANGANIAVTAGTYDIFLDFNDGETYTIIAK